jgi:RNA polymerase sigma-70 factor (ECF subfamily)
MSETSFADMMVAEMPYLRAFALSLSGSAAFADDLVQETLIKAWTHEASFARGTNFRAWLVTILRNTYFNEYRKRGREVQDSDHTHAESIPVGGDQEANVTMRDVQRALDRLPPEQREILLMIGVTELSYEEAAVVCDIAIGTVKSRLNRARARLAELLGMTGGEAVAGFVPGPERKSGGAT